MILVVAGTRPEIIKQVPVYVALQKLGLEARWLWLGQQPDLGPETFQAFGLEPEFRCDLAREKGTLGELFSRLAIVFDEVLDGLHPEMVIVQGDTMTAAVGAQLAFLKEIPVAHVEAGLRSWDVKSPFPEEAGRVWIDDVADLKFAPTQQAAATLTGKVFVTGQTGVDALQLVKRIETPSGRYVMVTLHRRENAGAVEAVCQAVKEIVASGDVDFVVWPVHPNPTVRETVPVLLQTVDDVWLTPPLRYDVMVSLMEKAQLVLTDSGGVQEDAVSLHVPCLVMREHTERPEGVAVGGAKLVGTDTRKLVGWTRWLLTDEEERQKMVKVENPFGDGRAGERIALVCRAWLQGQDVNPKLVSWSND